MLRILSNMPLQCFDAREEFRGVEFLSYGPEHRMWVDGVHYPPDLVFDPSQGSLEELLSILPGDFYPDLLLIYWPDQDPLPSGMERCPVPSIGIISDYNLSLPYVTGLWPFFDILLCDRGGVEVFTKLPFADVRYFCQYSFKSPTHRLYPAEIRSLDVGFAGNLNPTIQIARAPWIERLLALKQTGMRCEVRDDVRGESYGRFLNRARIGFNHSIRGEMNLRAFEVPACGALLFMESSNREVREFFEPGREVVLYDEGNFEELLREHIADQAKCKAMAQAGYERVQEYRMSRRIDALLALISAPGPGRPAADPFTLALGRGTAMLSSWAPKAAAIPDLLRAHKLALDDPRPLNALALAILHSNMDDRMQRAAKLFARATEIAPDYLPAIANLAQLYERARRPAEQTKCRRDLESRLSRVSSWRDVEGPLLPLGYSERNIKLAGRLSQALLAGQPQELALAFSE